MKKWTKDVIGPQTGKVALITGGTYGAGLEVARELSHHGARVILCTDDIFRGESALAEIRQTVEKPKIEYQHVDLGDLNSVKDFCKRFMAEYDQLHILINNAEISNIHDRITSAQGHELMFSYNYLSHFALTATLFPLMERVHDARIIFQSNLRHSSHEVDFFDLESENHYRPHAALTQSKLALLVFARELDRRARAINLDVKSIPIHTGGFNAPLIGNFLNFTFRRTPLQASLPILFAATADEAIGGHYYGPTGLYELWGSPGELDFATQSKNLQTAERLWEISEQMTGVDFKMHDLTNVIPFQQGRENIGPEFFT
jgi:NAD(P)-dependent dehydrogenase (short-subunit alcohol dehydrogenase family)